MDGWDLTQKQCAVLQLIGANPGVSQVDLASTLGTDRATMMAVIDRLDERGFLLRLRSKADRRRQELTLTPAGEVVLAQTNALINSHDKRFTSLFTRRELDMLVGALRRIHKQV
jgi:DNA-binding MarR family transcriptional regulator